MSQAERSADDKELARAFRSLDPGDRQVDRMARPVMAAFRMRHRTLASEWLWLLRARPVANTALALVAALMLLVTTPMGTPWAWLLRGWIQSAGAQGVHLVNRAQRIHHHALERSVRVSHPHSLASMRPRQGADCHRIRPLLMCELPTLDGRSTR